MQTTEIELILRTHARIYPKMQPTDAVKLIYQNEFGPGHFVCDPQKSLAYLKAEHILAPFTPKANTYESIGNSLVRVHLCAIQMSALSELNEAFVATANAHKGALSAFLEKLEILKSLTEQGIFAFKKEELLARKRTKAIAEARQIAMYLITEFLNIPLESVGNIFGSQRRTP